jgi:hypothetical protein
MKKNALQQRLIANRAESAKHKGLGVLIKSAKTFDLAFRF